MLVLFRAGVLCQQTTLYRAVLRYGQRLGEPDMRPEQARHFPVAGQSLCRHCHDRGPSVWLLVTAWGVPPAGLARKPTDHEATAQMTPLIVADRRLPAA